MVSTQHATIVTNTPFQPQWSAIQPTPVPAIAEPNTYPKKPGEARGGARRLLRHEVERVQADDHDRSVDQEADRDERRIVDPERAVHVEPVGEHRDQREAP